MGAVVPAQAQKKPMNIVFIMSDDHSYQTISAYDKRFISTPNIDWLADNGVKFQESFVANSLSGPSRACMLTGKHSHANGFTDNTKTFDGSQQTFPKLLQKQGYQTAMIGNGISPHSQQALITGTSSSDRATTTTLTSLAMGREYAVRAMSRILLQTWR